MNSQGLVVLRVFLDCTEDTWNMKIRAKDREEQPGKSDTDVEGTPAVFLGRSLSIQCSV